MPSIYKKYQRYRSRRARTAETGVAGFRFDLGIRSLIPEWKKLLSTQYLNADLMAGLTVACIAIPLSLAIALASGVRPEVGLISAVVGSLVVALFGGTPLAVSGPAAAMAVLIAETVQRFGVGGLLIVGLLCGVLQVFTGIFNFGRFIRFVPVPVIAGFTAGIGAIILIGQLPRALDLPAPEHSQVFHVLAHIWKLAQETHPSSYISALLLCVGTVGAIFVVPKFFPRLPAPLLAVGLFTIVAKVFGFEVEQIGQIPASLPAPKFPEFPTSGWGAILTAGFTVYALASLETLLSSSAVDKVSKSKRHDPNQELIGQGLGNVATALFGGIPITGVIARSALNVQAGAKTRRSPIIHALALIFVIYFASQFIAYIPISVLAGVLISVALKMLHPGELVDLWKSSRIDALVYLVTFAVIVCTDLIAGIQAGVGVALVIAALKLGQTQTMIHAATRNGLHSVGVGGSLTFMSSAKIEVVRVRLLSSDLSGGLIIDLSEVTEIDASGAAQFSEMLGELLDSASTQVAIRGASAKVRRALLANDSKGRFEKLFAFSESDALALLGHSAATDSLGRLHFGIERFRREVKPSYSGLFDKLSVGQKPHTLFITCSDSRIDPNLLTSTDPGEMFIVRNVGNIIPAFEGDNKPAEGAAIEFALGVLGVKEIILCGHSHCGAMAEIMTGSLLTPEKMKMFPSIVAWLNDVRSIREELPPGSTPDQATQKNVLRQVENLMTYPLIKEKLAKGQIRIHAWYYNLATTDIEQWNPDTEEFRPIDVEMDSKTAG